MFSVDLGTDGVGVSAIKRYGLMMSFLDLTVRTMITMIDYLTSQKVSDVEMAIVFDE